MRDEARNLRPEARVAEAVSAAAFTVTPAIDNRRAAEELAALADNLGVGEAFHGIVDEVQARAQASTDWGRPHEVAAEVRRRLLEIALKP